MGRISRRGAHASLTVLTVTVYVLAATFGVLLALTIGSIGKGNQEQRAYDLVASQQRTMQALDPESFAAKQLQQQIEAEVLFMNNNIVHPSIRRRYALWAVVSVTVLVAQLVSYLGKTSPSHGDGVVTAFGVGFFGLQTFGAMQVVLHRNRIRPLLESGEPAKPEMTAAELPTEEPPSPATV